jgi:hypothetical protein
VRRLVLGAVTSLALITLTLIALAGQACHENPG